LIHFDIDNRYQDELLVGSAISRREGVIFSVVSHSLLILAIFLGPRLPFFQVSPEELARRRAALQEQLRAQQDPTFVFVQPEHEHHAREVDAHDPSSAA
jgi:hypothetical protein